VQFGKPWQPKAFELDDDSGKVVNPSLLYRPLKWRRPLAGILMLSALFALSACVEAPRTRAGSALAFEDCRIKNLDTQARCATLEVADGAIAPGDKKVKIHVAFLPALTRFPEKDPVFFFAGGPGQAASDIGILVSALFTLRRNRDIVLVDQRGTGRSKTLQCDSSGLEPEKLPPEAQLAQALNATAEQVQKEWRRCVETLKGNPATHRTDDYIADLEAVRKAMGYEKINVWGGSYGSRVALRYMKLHPTSIRSAVLDGVAPTTLRLPNDALINSDAQLRQVVSACAQSENCARQFPNLERELTALLVTLRSSPRSVSIAHPATGKTLEARLTDISFASTLWPMLYIPETSRMLPFVVSEASRGNFAPFAGLLSSGSATADVSVSVAQRFAVMCAEDMSGQTPVSNERFGAVAANFFEFCKGFPHGRVNAEFFEPTQSDIPTLLLSGSLDPVTPPSAAELAAKTLTQKKHVVVEGLGHIVSPNACVARLIRKFVEAGVIAEASDTCESELKLPRPLFYVSAMEAKP
jgi:pimeloyl-ACP methyl ester carboxylesterase